MKTKLLKILQMTPENYEALVLDNYLLWCNLNSYQEKGDYSEWCRLNGYDAEDHVDLQKLLANTALFNWWQIQYRHLEEIFMQDAKEYHAHCHKRVMRTFYAETTIDIARYYPKALIKAARNQTPLTPQLN